MNAVRIDPTMESLCFALERLRQDYQSVLQELADAKLQIAQLTLAAQMNHDTIVNRHVMHLLRQLRREVDRWDLREVRPVSERTSNQYRVYVRSKPGMYAQYDGYVDVWVREDQDIFDQAVRELRRTSFPDRSRDMWRLDRIEARS